MTTYNFLVKEVNRDGYIAWDAIEDSTQSQFPINLSGSYIAGTFPEITDYLKEYYNLVFNVIYLGSVSDTFDQSSNTWIFNRGADRVVVKDIPRTIFRVTKY